MTATTTSTTAATTDTRKAYKVPSWPLYLVGAPAAVAVWAGWVGLGGLCGFGLVQPLPGIVAWHLDTAITLPVGVEAYGALALRAWLTLPRTACTGRRGSAVETARRFARGSAISALGLGMTGQAAFHILSAAHVTRAPWVITALVACLPVVAIGLGAALIHLLRAAAAELAETGGDPGPGKGTRPALAGGYPSGPDAIEVPPGTPIRITPGVPGPVFSEREVPEAPVPAEVPAPVSAGSSETAPDRWARDGSLSPESGAGQDGPGPETAADGAQHQQDAAAADGPALLPAEPSEALSAAEAFYMSGLAAGRVPGVKRIRADLHVGQARATAIRDHLKSVAAGTPGTPARPELRVVRGGAR